MADVLGEWSDFVKKYQANHVSEIPEIMLIAGKDETDDAFYLRFLGKIVKRIELTASEKLG